MNVSRSHCKAKAFRHVQVCQACRRVRKTDCGLCYPCFKTIRFTVNYGGTAKMIAEKLGAPLQSDDGERMLVELSRCRMIAY